MIDVLIDELDRQLDELLASIRADLLADPSFPSSELPRATAAIAAKLAAHREIAIARLQRSAGAPVH